MHNRGSAAGIAAISIVAILWSGWYGPYGPYPVPEWSSMYWIVTGFFSLVLAAALVSAVYRWNCTISGHAIFVTKSILFWRSVHRTPREDNLEIRIEVATGSDDTTDTIFPCRVRLVDGQEKSTNLWLDFQHKANADRFVGALRRILPVKVEYWTTRGQPLDQGG